MRESVFSIPKMDCPSEEQLIRTALAPLEEIKLLKFDLNDRRLTAFHETETPKILEKLAPLNFGATIKSDRTINEIEENLILVEKAKIFGNQESESNVLKVLLAINATMFVAEIIFGFIAQSTGLIADAMDMLADAAVYGVSLYAVGKALSMQRKAARMSGYMQMALALFAFVEVLRRFIFGSDPEPNYMMVVSLVAFVANVSCLALISKHREGGVHMRASWIFSTNDVLANIGVVIAGVLVKVFRSPWPDLVVGAIIAVIVCRGAVSILKISSAESTPTIAS